MIFTLDSDWCANRTTITAKGKVRDQDGRFTDAVYHAATVIPLRKPGVDAPFEERRRYGDAEYAAMRALEAAIKAEPERYRDTGKAPRTITTGV